MNHKPIRIAVLTNIIPTYRQGFYDRLFARNDISVTVYCQREIPGMNLKSIHERYGDRIKLVKYLSAKGEKVAWQFMPWIEIYRNFDVIFVQGNPRYMSDLIFGPLLKLTGKKIVLWTMAHSYNGSKLFEKLRLLWSSIYKNIFVYTDVEVGYLRGKGFMRHHIVGMNNGLDQKFIDRISSLWNDLSLDTWRKEKKMEGKRMVLSCARLVEKNQFIDIISALPVLVKQFPDLKWCLIGDGPERKLLETTAKSLGVEENVYFVGELYDESLLAPWFLSSEIFIHPAAVGLGLMHAFGYGLPVVIHGDILKHGPEFGAFVPGKSGLIYENGNISQLSKAIGHLLKNTEQREKMKSFVLKIVREKYNVDVMVNRFVEIAKYAYNN